jgi:glycine/D-amino acid oxidase-like deaminating enzyme
MPERAERFEVGIIGAGAVGCAVAYSLAKRRVPVLVLDRGGAGGGASAATSARVWAHTEDPPDVARMIARAAQRFPGLQEEIGPVEFLRTGGLAPVLTADEERRAQDLVARQAAAGLSARWLSREETLRLEPALTPLVRGATYSPDDGSVNPFLLVRRLVGAARRLGAAFSFHCGYVAVRSQPGGVALLTGRGEFWVRRLIIAAGVGVSDLLAQVGVSLPLRPVFTHFAVTEKVPPLLRHTLSTMRQQLSGEVVVEHPREGPPVQCEAAPGVLLDLAREATRLVPSLGPVPMLRAFTGVRAVPVDGLPVLGAVEERIFVVLALRGIALCPLLGEAVADLVLRGRAGAAFERWSPARFREVQTNSPSR